MHVQLLQYRPTLPLLAQRLGTQQHVWQEHCTPEQPVPGQAYLQLFWCHDTLFLLLQAGSCTAESAGTWVAASGQRGCRGSDGHHSGSGGQAGCGEAVRLASLIVLHRLRQGWMI